MSNFRETFTCIHFQGVYVDQPALSCDCMENPEAFYAKGVIAPLGKNYSVVDAGALQLAINVLRRAGKDEIADELEATSTYA